MSNPTEKEIEQCAEILGRLPTGRLPAPIFYKILEKTVQTALEVVPFCETPTCRKVLLLPRPDTDPYYPNEMHSPGVMVVSTDVEDGTYRVSFNRLVETELQDVDIETEPVFVESKLLHTKRGVENALIHWIRVSPESSGRGTFYDVDALPTNLIDHHHQIIPVAYRNYQLNNAHV